jgi:adenylosuccinate synthase
MNATILVDLTFGDAGKGSLVDYLVRRDNAHTVIRFNGGAQAAHNVVLPDGRHHTFSQFGSGTFVPGVRTHLSRFMLFDPLALAAEERHLRSVGVTDAFDRLTLDRRALVVTPFQRAANRLREVARGDARHGSCGMGIGETMSDVLDDNLALRGADLLNPSRLRRTLRQVQEAKRRLAGTLALPRDDSSGGLAARELDPSPRRSRPP